MVPGLYSAAAGIRVAEMNHDVLTQNLANIDTPGYRRAMAVFETTSLSGPGDSFGRSFPVVNVNGGENFHNFEAGNSIHTGRDLDVALEGDGFMVVDGPYGPLYTRNGVFHLTGTGDLVTSSGMAVQGETGAITLPPNTTSSEVTIQRDGTFVANGIPFGKLRVVRFDNVNELRAEGPTLFSAPGEPEGDPDTQVYQGYRESSNVSATDELVRMIVGMRQHEAAQRSLQSISEALRQNIGIQGGQ
ncbi:MAG: flagellar hook basal-body protein [Planctomycetales bacterium]|nr:flagellar hook basal-body protein [Planctomycetales bacterium]